jgi:hypothetical protein
MGAGAAWVSAHPRRSSRRGMALMSGGSDDEEGGLVALREALRQGGAPRPAHVGGGAVRQVGNGARRQKT